MSNVTDRVIIDSINQMLHQNYARSLDGRPVFRIVFSDDQLEKKIGDFTDWYGHIMIRQEYKALREVKKYPYIQGKWIFEKLVFLPPGSEAAKTLVEAEGRGSYEAIYVFQDARHNPLSVTWWAVEAILQALSHAGEYRQSDKEMWEEYHQTFDDDQNYFEECLHEEGRSDTFAFEDAEVLDKVGMWGRYKDGESESTEVSGRKHGDINSPSSDKGAEAGVETG